MTIQASSVAEARRQALSQLQQVGIESSLLDVNVLLGQATGLEPAEVVLHTDDGLSAQQLEDFDRAVQRRIRHEPVAYIAGTKGFRRIDLQVSPSVLVPRPETEVLVQVALDMWDEAKCDFVVDVGTGSGAVGLALAEERPGLRVLATDISAAALDVAVQNRQRLGLVDRVRFTRADGLAGIALCGALVVANLPYIATSVIPTLQPDILEWEPRMALDGGNDGLAVIRYVVGQLKQSGAVGAAFEVGMDQSVSVGQLLADVGFSDTSIHYDFSGCPRVVTGLGSHARISGVRHG